MSKKEQLSQLRKKLESSSRKTRRSTDLRRSLGRKSIGDLTPGDLAALEQPSTSSDESCHLNPDSAVIDPEFTDNPEWFKKSCLQGVLASQDSINAAIQQERAANIVDTSNVDELDFESFNPRDINKILGSPWTVNKSAIEALTRKVSLGSSSSTLESPNGNDSLEPPQRKPSAFRRKITRNPAQSNNIFSKALDEEQAENKTESFPLISKHTSKLHQEQHTTGSDESNSNLSLELPKRKPSAFRRGKKLVSKEVQARPNMFTEVLEETTDQDEKGVGVTSVERNISLPSPNKSSRKSHNHSSDASLSESLKPPEPKRSRFRRGAHKSQPNSQPERNIFEDILNETADMSVEGIANKTQEQAQGNESLDSDDSLPLPHRKTSSFKRGVGLRSKVSATGENIFTHLLEESSITGDHAAGMSPEKGNKPEHGSGESDYVDCETQVKSSFADDDSMEVLKQKTTSLKQGEKKKVLATEKNLLTEIPESYVELPECGVDQFSKAEKLSIHSHRKSLDELNKDKVNSSPQRKLLSVRQPSTDAKENMLPSLNFEEAHVDSLNNTLESLPLGAEANNFSGGMLEPDPKRRFKLSLTKIPSTNLEGDKTSRFPGSTKKSDAALMLNVELPNPNNVSNLSSSVTDHTRDAPRRASSIVIKTPDMNLNQTNNQRASKSYGNSINVSNVSNMIISEQNNSLLADKEIALPESDVLEEGNPLSISLSSGVTSPKNAALHARDFIDASSPTKAKASTPSNGQRNHSVGNILSTSSIKMVSKSQQGPSGDAGDDSDSPDHSNVSSCNEEDDVGSDEAISSIAGNDVSEDDSGNDKGSESSLSICSAKTCIVPDSALVSISTNAYAVPTPPSTDASSLTQSGSDAVFKSNQTATSSNITEVSEKVPAKLVNESWPENPFVDVPHGSGLERSFSNPAMSDQAIVVEGVPSSLTSLHEEVHSSLQSIETIETNTNPSYKSTLSATALGSNQGSHASGPGVRLPATSTLSYQQRLQPSKRKLSEKDMEKMRAGMTKWFENIKKNKTVIEGKPIPDFKKPDPVKKPDPIAPKKPVKKKEPCPYFGDYKPPRRVKPKPYVTKKMYKFLETKLQLKFGLEYRVKAEEFVTFLCDQVSQTLKRKHKYHALVLQLRKEMYSLGLIKTQFDFYLFIEDYLPDAFREKAVPCYGSTKAPPFDSNDIHKDLCEVI